MHRFIEYISDLLFLHDCVIIPEFGGFICNYRSAYIDETSGIIYPPGKDILFNRNLTHNDGLLVNWIATKENISYDKAIKQIELFCEDLKVRLNQKQRVAFGDIGTFYTDRRFNVIFESGENNFLSDTYGMDQVEAEPIASEEKKTIPNQIHIPASQEMSPYLNMESRNWIHRTLKYGLAAAVVAGAIMMTHLGIIYYKNIPATGIVTNVTTIQPVLPPDLDRTPVRIQNTIHVSPDCDYVDYDPMENSNL